VKRVVVVVEDYDQQCLTLLICCPVFSNCSPGLFPCNQTSKNPQHIPRVTCHLWQGYGFFKGFQIHTLTLTLCTRTHVPMGFLKPLPITTILVVTQFCPCWLSLAKRLTIVAASTHIPQWGEGCWVDWWNGLLYTPQVIPYGMGMEWMESIK